ncbi:MAG TPA: head-tail connector protein [Arenicellales bacterium]|nr:head-tail connector protein [Arenicellales bacterium]
MSELTLESVKQYLRVIHDADDTLLQNLLDAAEDEAKRFTNRDYLPTLPLDYPEESSSEDIPSSGDPIAPSVFTAVCCLVKADYEAGPEDARLLRQAAETKLMPYRTEIGV